MQFLETGRRNSDTIYILIMLRDKDLRANFWKYFTIFTFSLPPTPFYSNYILQSIYLDIIILAHDNLNEKANFLNSLNINYPEKKFFFR